MPQLQVQILYSEGIKTELEYIIEVCIAVKTMKELFVFWFQTHRN